MSDQQPGRFLKILHSIVFGPTNGRSSLYASDGVQPALQNTLGISDGDCDISLVHSPYLRTVVRQALLYRERIRTAIDRPNGIPACELLQEIARQVGQCVRRMYQVAVQLDAVKQPAADRQAGMDGDGNQPEGSGDIIVPGLADSDNIAPEPSRLSGEMGSTADSIGAIDTIAQQLEETLSILGMVYSLILFLDGRDIDAAGAQRLQDSLASQIAALDQTQSAFISVASPVQT
ncbi:MAG: hypothetical protein M1434_04860 [Chloroflexi bacterium]|nr:hypothetical protein [Chloroflexota bacterium]MCL5274063.1 hypothetical protein [Chloroflexota bacterium]